MLLFLLIATAAALAPTLAFGPCTSQPDKVKCVEVKLLSRTCTYSQAHYMLVPDHNDPVSN